MIHIKVYNNNVEKALSKLKKEVKETKLMLELREREYYTKPSVKRATKKKLGKVRNWLNQKKLNPDCCGEPPTSGLKEKIKKEQIHYVK